jgi:phospho-N-acetylmuramoyl-pentapeptide-transferase
VSNGANITDGLDGLATGVSAIIGIALGIFAYVSVQYQIRRIPQYNVHPQSE